MHAGATCLPYFIVNVTFFYEAIILWQMNFTLSYPLGSKIVGLLKYLISSLSALFANGNRQKGNPNHNTSEPSGEEPPLDHEQHPSLDGDSPPLSTAQADMDHRPLAEPN